MADKKELSEKEAALNRMARKLRKISDEREMTMLEGALNYAIAKQETQKKPKGA